MTGVDFHAVMFSYSGERGRDGDVPPALVDVDLAVPSGEFLLVVGESGSGKSTLLRCPNGLVPHAHGGRFSGDVRVGGRSTRECRPRDLADVVGFVHQDPEAQFVVDNVERDIAFVLENLGEAPATMRRRVEEVLDALGVAHLRDRSPSTLSGGERQRCAIAAALASAPGVLVLDEPTSQLDPQGAEDVLAGLARLNADLGTTVMIAEHRLDRAAPLVDRAVLLRGGAVVADGEPGETLAPYGGAPSVTRLGSLLGWDPPPLTVKAARARTGSGLPVPPAPEAPEVPAPGDPLVRGRDLVVELGRRDVLHGVDLDVHAGSVVALLGRNGSGKTTLLRAVSGLQGLAGGAVEATVRVAYVPQDPNLILSASTVRSELETTLRLLGRRSGSRSGSRSGTGSSRQEGGDSDVDRWLDVLGLERVADRHPRSLSGGQRQRVAIAAVAVGGAPVLLLDEPTRGMDAPSRESLAGAVSAHAASGGAVVLATHDVELAARVATRVVVLGDGDVVADGPAREVLSGSLFAPQTLRVVPPFLTVDEVEAALEPAPAGPGEGGS